MSHPVVGEVEDDGTAVRCYLCEWMTETSSVEEAEFRFAKHLRDVHNKRIETVDGEAIPYPFDP